MVGMTGIAGAYEVEGNPDRKISFGFNYDRYDAPDDSLGKNFGHTFEDIRADVRVPVFTFLTLSVGAGVWNDARLNLNGYNTSAGFRVYIP